MLGEYTCMKLACFHHNSKTARNWFEKVGVVAVNRDTFC